MSSDRRFAFAPRLVIGLGVIALGVVFLLDEMDRLEADDLLRFWPLLLVALGVSWFLEARETAGRLVGGVAAGAGLWFLADNLGLVSTNPLILLRYFWPALLVTVGAALVWRSLRGPRARTDGVAEADRLNAFALLSGVEMNNASQAFAGGQATAVMGGCEIDLRQAKMAGEEAVIEVFAMWGGIDIKVPPTWQVVGRVTPILGGFESKAAAPAAIDGRLVVSGSAIMGGVDVHN